MTLIFFLDFEANIMNKADRLGREKRLVSLNGRFEAFVSQEGEFGVFSGELVLWQTDTGSKNATHIEFLNDGNLVLYDEAQRPIWSSRTQSRGEYLICQDNGELVIFDSKFEPIWTTNTVQSKSNYLNNLNKII